MPLTVLEINTILIKKLPNLTKKEIDDFFKITTYKKIDNKNIILKSGYSSKKAFLTLKGTVRGYITNKEGVEKSILIRSEGIFVADVRKLFSDEPQRFSFEAIGTTHILLFSYKDFEDLANKNPNIMQLYLHILKEAVVRLTYRIESLVTMTNEERYLDLLKLNPKFLDKVYDKLIANYLGITNVSLSRIRKRLKENKVNNC